MKSKKKPNYDISSDDIWNAIGLFAAFGIASYLLKLFAKRTETRIISHEARKILDDNEKAYELRKVIDKYQVTGEWDTVNIEKINS